MDGRQNWTCIGTEYLRHAVDLLRGCRRTLGEVLPLPVFGLLAGVEGGYGAVVTHDPGPYFAAGAFAVFQLDTWVLGGPRAPALSVLAPVVYFVVQMDDLEVGHCVFSPVPVLGMESTLGAGGLF